MLIFFIYIFFFAYVVVVFGFVVVRDVFVVVLIIEIVAVVLVFQCTIGSVMVLHAMMKYFRRALTLLYDHMFNCYLIPAIDCRILLFLIFI